MTKVHVATDHAGFDFKEVLKEHLREQGFEVVDHGAYAYDALDDYPPMCIACGEAVAASDGDLGVVIGGSGNGEQMAANLVDGVRAALVWSEEIARLARSHNNANVAAIGARQHSPEDALAIVDAFLDTPYPGVERHENRIKLMSEYERERCSGK